MPLIHDYLFAAMWLSYMAYWWAMSRDVKPTERSESGPSRLARLAALVCAVTLLWLPSVPLPFLNARFLPRGEWCFWSGAAITATGLLFSVWGRRHLGSNWSQEITLKTTNSLPVVPTLWFVIPSILGFCWHFLVARWPVANGADYLP